MTGATSKTKTAPPIPFLARIEEGAIVAVLAAMVILPVGAVILRWLTGSGLIGANVWVQHLNLWLAFIGAVIAARTGHHLNLSTGELFKLDERLLGRLRAFTSAVAAAVTAYLAYASVLLVQTEYAAGHHLPGGIPVWFVQAAMPVGFAGTAFYLAWTQNEGWRGRLTALLFVIGAIGLAFVPVGSRGPVVWACSGVLLVAVALGAPIFTVMGGLAMLLFYGQPLPTPISAVPVETFELVSSPTLPAIPLFTLAGYLLAEGGASKRLVALFQEWFGWLPGGIAAAAVLVCAFFTTFTGASGVTILALGGLLLPTLLKAGYKEHFAIGLLIASGSIGLLFPPSLPVILYGVVAQVPIDKLFVAGALPGILLVGLLIGMGVWHAVRNGVERSAFVPRTAFQTLWGAKWEAAMPVLVLVAIFGGFLTIFEAAAFTAAYAFFTEVVVHRDLDLKTDVPRVFVECGTLMGGVLIILGVSLGFTNYLIDAEIPQMATEWARTEIGTKVIFILLLNVFLLIVGCLMDIFSAIVVVVPLIVPIAQVFGMDPIHLGILFLANLELGYLTPPVGMNLFLGAYRFDKPVTTMYRVALPFLGMLAVGVLVIAYVPALTTWAHSDEDTTGIDFEADLQGGELGEPAENATGTALPLGNLDLDALLNADDDDSTAEPATGDDDSAETGDDDSAEKDNDDP
jgi:tripartite ATP-independent transporter DctM subunit